MIHPAWAVAFVLLSTSIAAHAVNIAYEGFDYPDAVALNGQIGGTNWNGAWTNSGAGSIVRSPGLTYTDANLQSLMTVGNSGQFASANNGNFRLPLTTPETVGTSLYVSFIARMDAAGAPFYAGFSLFNGAASETLFLGDPSAPTAWGIDTKSGVVVNSTTSVATQTFLVFRIDFLASSAEIRLFENPLLNTEPTNAQAAAFATKTAALVWDRVRVQSNHLGVIDEIRIGTTYYDVVPEPGVFGLLAVGAVGFGTRRRRALGC
jgi:hypothetical protein